jgi:hypothetical protein
MKSTIISLFALGLVLTFAPSASKAQPTPNPPGQISYQGFLTDANGFPLATNNPVNYNVQFKIWNASSAGQNLWGELQVVTVDRGYFTVMLGNGVALQGGVPFTNNLAAIFSGSDASDRYLEMTVQGLAPNDPPIQPRLRLLASPYSYLASKALSASSVPDGGLSANVALRAGGNTFSGNQTINGGSIYMDNNQAILAKDTTLGTVNDDFLIPRGSDNSTLLRYGSGGLSITPSPYQTSIIIPPPPPAVNEIGGLFMPPGPSGYVGIGTSSPGAMLDVNGGGIFRGPVGIASIVANNTNIINNTLEFGMGKPGKEQNAGKIGYEVFTSDSLDIVGAGTSGSNRKIKFWAEGGATFNGTVNVNSTANILGYVGIGTTTPASQLDVEGWSTLNGYVVVGTTPTGTPYTPKGQLEIQYANGYQPGYTHAAWLQTNFVSGTSSVGAGYDISLWASGWVFANTFIAFSDARIKNIQGQSDSTADLKTLLGIEVTDFTYKDTVAKGNRPQKKVIAQQVEQVYPQAVSKGTDVVPDIYRNATLKDGWVQLATDLKVGERVQLLGEKEKGIYPVLEVRAGAFRTDFKPAMEQVFVYGREVKDFRSVDYEAISMLNVSATQELAKRVQKLEAREAHLAELEQKASQVASLEQEVAGLKKMVAQLAAASRTAKPTALLTPPEPPSAEVASLHAD